MGRGDIERSSRRWHGGQIIKQTGDDQARSISITVNLIGQAVADGNQHLGFDLEGLGLAISAFRDGGRPLPASLRCLAMTARSSIISVDAWRRGDTHRRRRRPEIRRMIRIVSRARPSVVVINLGVDNVGVAGRSTGTGDDQTATGDDRGTGYGKLGNAFKSENASAPSVAMSFSGLDRLRESERAWRNWSCERQVDTQPIRPGSAACQIGHRARHPAPVATVRIERAPRRPVRTHVPLRGSVWNGRQPERNSVS